MSIFYHAARYLGACTLLSSLSKRDAECNERLVIGSNIAFAKQNSFKTHPAISNEDYLAAYNWNKLDMQIRFVRSAGVYMVKAHKPNTESELTLSQEECTSYFRAVRDLDFQSLDSLLDTVHSLHAIKINVDDWSMSECTCSFWLKNYKCCHVIATAFR
jgi:hypothetical protein